MKQSQFDAKTFGLGELITQRKLFRVPRHQRSYAWAEEQVQAFLEDVDHAFFRDASDYFVGLIVIQGPDDGEWTLLDGQQRLTTTTLIYAAIRDWLQQQRFDEDAKQIENEYLGVRRLGGEYSSRLLLNHENATTFESIVIQRGNRVEPETLQKQFAKRSSNRLLLDAAVQCREWVHHLADTVKGPVDEQARQLFRIASFIEGRVKVVCVEVSNEVDAYILFESLNDRGVELSTLDLVKNYIFSNTSRTQETTFTEKWGEFIEKSRGSES